MVPQLIFGLLAGVVADRYDKRLDLMASQTVTLLIYFFVPTLRKIN
jgi:hypothetical protein